MQLKPRRVTKERLPLPLFPGSPPARGVEIISVAIIVPGPNCHAIFIYLNFSLLTSAQKYGNHLTTFNGNASNQSGFGKRGWNQEANHRPDQPPDRLMASPVVPGHAVELHRGYVPRQSPLRPIHPIRSAYICSNIYIDGEE